ncbi:MAG: hypothetical protein A3G41_00785 [Elusimicrobia bacterium RIFCSPLOWO2_12_FULL_59_9]|nr:MAG: hypothetical protein A3G41_00785 [Elusimicrobia bacterium RIFCSPLOWO2_12_FULL_59_9]
MDFHRPAAGSLTALLAVAWFLPLTAHAKMLSVKNKEADVYNLKRESEWKAWIYTPFKVIPLENGREFDAKGWYKVEDYEKKQWWVHGNDLDTVPTVIVSNKNANLREGPGDNFKGQIVEKGYPFKVLAQEGNWIQVTDDANPERIIQGWLHKSTVWGFTVKSEPRKKAGKPAKKEASVSPESPQTEVTPTPDAAPKTPKKLPSKAGAKSPKPAEATKPIQRTEAPSEPPAETPPQPPSEEGSNMDTYNEGDGAIQETPQDAGGKGDTYSQEDMYIDGQ